MRTLRRIVVAAVAATALATPAQAGPPVPPIQTSSCPADDPYSTWACAFVAQGEPFYPISDCVATEVTGTETASGAEWVLTGAVGVGRYVASVTPHCVVRNALVRDVDVSAGPQPGPVGYLAPTVTFAPPDPDLICTWWGLTFKENPFELTAGTPYRTDLSCYDPRLVIGRTPPVGPHTVQLHEGGDPQP